MSYFDDFSQHTKLTKYGANALLLYALQLKYEIEDIDSVAADALIDGSDDKKCDLLYVDSDSGVAVIAQGYLRKNVEIDTIAKSNKASDLNTASGWLFCRDLREIPEKIRDAFASLRAEIDKGNIHTINFWYVHNCAESVNVREELITVERQAQITVDNVYPEKNISIIALEVGSETLQKWFDSTKRIIAIEDEIALPLVGGHFELVGGGWKACQTCIKGTQLFKLCKEYGDELFSANPRRFLGVDRKSKIRLINQGIQKTALDTPENFWAYNNGITGITYNYKIENGQIICKGLSIINGAQTSGAISSLPTEPNKQLVISMRIVMCNEPEIVKAIIDNNNKQNAMLPSDFRSNDNNQRRLRDDFRKYSSYYYSGGLRDDANTRGREPFDHLLVGQVLMAFNGEPTEAYNEKTNIWREDSMYGSVFNEALTADHIIFVYSLSKAIDQIKQELKDKQKAGTITTSEGNQLDFLIKRGTRILLLSTIATNIEIFTGKKIFSPNKLYFKESHNFSKCIGFWIPLVRTALPLHATLTPVLTPGGISNKGNVNAAMQTVGSLLSAIISDEAMIAARFNEFRDNLVC